MKKLIPAVFLCLFIINFVSSAVPAFIEGVNQNGFYITPMDRDTLKTSESHAFNFHVTNISTGLPVLENIICFFHLYDNNGTHIAELSQDAPSSVYDYDFTVDRGNFTKVGVYSYIISCNSTMEGGVLSKAVESTGTGTELTSQKTALYICFIVILFALFIIDLVVIKKLPSSNSYDDSGVLISINKLKYTRPIFYSIAYLLIMAVMFIAGNVSIAYMSEALIGNIFFKIFQIMASFLPVMVVLWIIYILYSAFQDKELKKYTENGWME